MDISDINNPFDPQPPEGTDSSDLPIYVGDGDEKKSDDDDKEDMHLFNTLNFIITTMIKKILTHIIFFGILLVIYITSCVLYSRGISGAIVYYFILTTLVFCVNLYKKRKVKWGIVVLIIILFLITAVIPNHSFVETPFDLFIGLSTVNIPFLPQFNLQIDSIIIRVTLLYLIYFWGAVLYWYCIYVLSKKIVARIKKEK
ncbi:MAG: hypothetical protein FWF54_09535 [Candidatus Azobacteroides sp.]|jgi:hypothetical protein|nr:hypothetical protein [Candidatus Azobacteroides sp.]